jgi:FKBP-type peptidyl-prolyl cis-trans isomerase 2
LCGTTARGTIARCYCGEVKIEKGRRIKLKVELAVAGGETLEKSVVEFIQGAGTMLPGLEAVLDGLEKGAKKDGVIKAKDAFGNPSMHPVKTMNRSEFPADAKLKVGERFTAKGANNGLDLILQVEKLDDKAKTVEVRLVHPLADKDIKYSCEVIQVSDPRPPPMPGAAFKLEEG